MTIYMEPPLDPPYDHEDRCPVCGWPLEWEDCEEPGCEDGYVSLYEEDPFFYDEDDVEPCQICGGKGGWLTCPNAHNHPKDGTL